MDTVSLKLEAIKDLLEDLKGDSIPSRLYAYTTIKSLVDELKEEAKDRDNVPIRNVNGFASELLSASSVLAGLEDASRDESEYVTYFLSAINKFKSFHCFNLESR